jgi:23S rRNA (guanosine2251-2'-O)-methyltransferase
MVGRKTKSSRKRELLGTHQSSWIWGRNLVLETLRARRWAPHELVISEELDEPTREEVIAAARDLGVIYELAPPARLEKLCQARDHQGLLAMMPPFPYSMIKEIFEQATTPELFVVLDSTQDPFNFGAICRTACVFGADGILIASKYQVGVTSQVARSSAGAVNRLKIARVDDLAAQLHALADRGVQTVATVLDTETTATECDFRKPSALVIGNEGAGLTPEVIAACRQSVRIPQASDFDSLNAAVATGVLLYEVHRQRADG